MVESNMKYIFDLMYTSKKIGLGGSFLRKKYPPFTCFETKLPMVTISHSLLQNWLESGAFSLLGSTVKICVIHATPRDRILGCSNPVNPSIIPTFFPSVGKTQNYLL